MAEKQREEMLADLATYGADFARWPRGANGAREAVLRDGGLRRAYEKERALDRRLAAYSDTLDAAIAEAGSLSRVQQKLAGLRRVDPLFGLSWRRLAAAVIVAGIAGGAVDLALPDRSADTIDVAIVDPLAMLDAADGQ